MAKLTPRLNAHDEYLLQRAVSIVDKIAPARWVLNLLRRL